MQRFFFDVVDGTRQARDDVGRALISPALAKIEAGVLLRSLAEINRLRARPSTVWVSVRDEHGRKIYEASTDVDGEQTRMCA